MLSQLCLKELKVEPKVKNLFLVLELIPEMNSTIQVGTLIKNDVDGVYWNDIGESGNWGCCCRNLG